MTAQSGHSPSSQSPSSNRGDSDLPDDSDLKVFGPLNNRLSVHDILSQHGNAGNYRDQKMKPESGEQKPFIPLPRNQAIDPRTEKLNWYEKLQNMSPLARKKFLQTRVAPAVFILVLLLGGLATYLTRFTSFDLRQWAWGGAEFNASVLDRTSLNAEARVSSGDPAVADLFTDLTYVFPQADVVNVSSKDHKIAAIAFKHYDAENDRSFIYVRITDFPALTSMVPKMWLESKTGQYLEAGVGQLLVENDQQVAYFISVLEGNTTEYQTLQITYDELVNQLKPSPALLKINFDDEDLEVTL